MPKAHRSSAKHAAPSISHGFDMTTVSYPTNFQKIDGDIPEDEKDLQDRIIEHSMDAAIDAGEVKSLLIAAGKSELANRYAGKRESFGSNGVFPEGFIPFIPGGGVRPVVIGLIHGVRENTRMAAKLANELNELRVARGADDMDVSQSSVTGKGGRKKRTMKKRYARGGKRRSSKKMVRKSQKKRRY